MVFPAELIAPLPTLLRGHASRSPDKIAFRDARRTVSYAELEVRTARLAGHLAQQGLRPGDRAAVLLGNRVENVEAQLGILRADGVGVPLDPRSSTRELDHLLADCGARVLITDTAHVEQVLGLVPNVIIVGEESFESLCGNDSGVAARDGLGLDEVAWLLYTSGTTGRPKGVRSTQRGYLQSVAACFSGVLGLSAEDEALFPTPIFHSLAHVLVVAGVVAVGATAHVQDGLTGEDVLTELTNNRYTFLTGVPTTYQQLVTAARRQPARDWALSRCFVAGAISAPSLYEEFEEIFGARLLNGYGSTETCGLMTVNPPDGLRVPGSCGLPVPGLAIRLVDRSTGEDGAEGEVCVQGESLFAGYHGDPAATEQAMRDG